MYQLLNQVGRPLPSPKDLFVLLVMCLAALGAGLKAQLPGQVTVLDTTSAPWSFLCSVEADPNSENLVFFDLPPLDYDLTMEPIFDPEGHCPDGCAWNWEIVEGHIEGLFVTLEAAASGDATVAQVDGWPIIDNIDIRQVAPVAEPSPTRAEPDAHPGMAQMIVVTDLSGRVVFAQDCAQGTDLCLPPLPHGIYVVAEQIQHRWIVRKIAR